MKKTVRVLGAKVFNHIPSERGITITRERGVGMYQDGTIKVERFKIPASVERGDYIPTEEELQLAEAFNEDKEKDRRRATRYTEYYMESEEMIDRFINSM